MFIRQKPTASGEDGRAKLLRVEDVDDKTGERLERGGLLTAIAFQCEQAVWSLHVLTLMRLLRTIGIRVQIVTEGRSTCLEN